jgi:hypothetical protein
MVIDPPSSVALIASVAIDLSRHATLQREIDRDQPLIASLNIAKTPTAGGDRPFGPAIPAPHQQNLQNFQKSTALATIVLRLVPSTRPAENYRVIDINLS